MEVQRLFPTHVAVDRVEGAAELNEQLIAEIQQVQAAIPNHKPKSWACNLYTTFPFKAQLHTTYPAFGRLARIMSRKTAEFGAFLGVDASQAVPVIPECWLNVYESTESQEAHNHGGFHISGVYYVEAPQGCGPISFYSPLHEDQFFPLPRSRKSFETQPIHTVQPEPGTMILFRSWLRHSAVPNNIAQRRVSIAFNAIFLPPGAAGATNASS